MRVCAIMESKMTKRLEGKVALVTGASKGIGAEIAVRLAAEGAAVAVNYSASKQAAERVVAAITGKGGTGKTTVAAWSIAHYMLFTPDGLRFARTNAAANAGAGLGQVALSLLPQGLAEA